jgi:hypothetical protein
VCAARASRGWLWEAEHGRNQPQGEHDCCEHQETLDHVRGVLGKDPNKCDRHSSHQEKAAAADNSQLQSEVASYAHGLIVPTRFRRASAFTYLGDVGICLWKPSVASASGDPAKAGSLPRHRAVHAPASTCNAITQFLARNRTRRRTLVAAIAQCGDQIIAAMAGRAYAYRESERTKGESEVRLVLTCLCASGYLSTQS